MGGGGGSLRGPEGVVLACLFMLHDRHPCSCNVRCRFERLSSKGEGGGCCSRHGPGCWRKALFGAATQMYKYACTLECHVYII